jgi:hypothetical protein
MLNGAHKLGSLQEGFMSASVQPRVTATKDLNMQVTTVKIRAVNAGDLQLPPRRWFDFLSYLDDIRIVEIKASNCKMGLRHFWFFFDGNGLSIPIKFHDAKTMGVVNFVTENGGPLLPPGGRFEFG